MPCPNCLDTGVVWSFDGTIKIPCLCALRRRQVRRRWPEAKRTREAMHEETQKRDERETP